MSTARDTIIVSNSSRQYVPILARMYQAIRAAFGMFLLCLGW